VTIIVTIPKSFQIIIHYKSIFNLELFLVICLAPFLVFLFVYILFFLHFFNVPFFVYLYVVVNLFNES